MDRVVYQAVLLEFANHTGHTHLCADPSNVYFYWNVFLASKYGGKTVGLAKREQTRLMAAVANRGYPLPRFISFVDWALGPQYLDSKAAKRAPQSADLFFAELVYYIAKEHIKEVALAPKVLTWLCEEVSPRAESERLPRILAALLNCDKRLKRHLSKGANGSTLVAITAWYIVYGLQNAATLNASLCDALIGIIEKQHSCSAFDAWVAVDQAARGFGYNKPNNGERLPASAAQVCLERFYASLIPNHPWLRACKTIPQDLKSMQVKPPKGNRLANSGGSNRSPSAGANCNSSRRKWKRVGVNLIGWPRTPIGIGEDVRTAAACLKFSDIPFYIIDAAGRLPPGPKQRNLGWDTQIKANPSFGTDLVFLDAATMYRYYLCDLAKGHSVNRKIIAVCPWELPKWPKEFGFVLELIHEFWAATAYIQTSFSAALRQRRSRVMAPAVVVPKRHWRKPGHINPVTKRFLTVFDGLSSIHRKNPHATVRAFKLAFPKEKSVELIIKTMNLRPDSPEIQDLLRLVSADRRIKIINETLSRSALWAHMKSSDCFVSLHRAEGFGRNIAEAMLIGCPVIASNFSGNTDFCLASNSFLVGGKMVPISAGQYSLSRGQEWFEPDVRHAAELMLDVFSNSEGVAGRAQHGREQIQTKHSVEQVSRNYRSALLATFQEGNS